MNKTAEFKLVENLLKWEGQFNSRVLSKQLELSRQSVSKLLKAYQEKHPHNLRYDASAKQFVPGENFKEHYGPNPLYECFQQNQQLKSISQQLPHLQVEPEPQIVQALIQAIRQQHRLDIRYISMSSPEFEERIISPHSFVFDGKRYHVRAWCEKNQDFRDFVLSRIHAIFAVEGKATKNQEDDKAWHEYIEFSIEPEPRLNEQQQKVIALDYGMEPNQQGRYQRSYSVSAALLLYYLQELRIETRRESPESQQIILSPESRETVVKQLPFMEKNL